MRRDVGVALLIPAGSQRARGGQPSALGCRHRLGPARRRPPHPSFPSSLIPSQRLSSSRAAERTPCPLHIQLHSGADAAAPCCPGQLQSPLAGPRCAALLAPRPALTLCCKLPLRARSHSRAAGRCLCRSRRLLLPGATLLTEGPTACIFPPHKLRAHNTLQRPARPSRPSRKSPNAHPALAQVALYSTLPNSPLRLAKSAMFQENCPAHRWYFLM